MAKSWQGNFFEDFELNQEIACPVPRTVTAGDVSAYIALTGDRTPVYCGPSGYVHPLVVFHTVFGQTVRHISLNARANLGYAAIRWLAPVRVGDTLSMQIRIVGLKENSNGTTGNVYVENRATNQDGVPILSFWRWVMVKKSGTEVTAYRDNPVIPKLPGAVAASDLFVNTDAIPTSRITGGRWAFEDYEAGERVQHYDGATVNHSDHMAFTRLFQNSAKVHFDAMSTDGKPLVYGGFPISHGYAQSLNGFDNRVGIAAINAGAHANPVYTGDTLYSFTDIVEVADLADSPVGALRLRLIVCKNVQPFAESPDAGAFEIMVDDPRKPGRKRHAPSVVLDLDYWELMPKRSTLDSSAKSAGNIGGN